MGSPEEAFSGNAGGADPNATFGKGSNVMVCGALATVSVLEGLDVPKMQVVPACVAVMVDVPAPTIVMVEPDTVATTGLELV